MPSRVLPDEDVIRRWYFQTNPKMTYQDMADRWNEVLAETRPDVEPVTRMAFQNQCHRLNLGRRNLQHTGGRWIPWSPIRPEHTATYEHCMLMRCDARDKGKKFSPKVEQNINAWLQGLRDRNAVIHYDPDTIQGWWEVTREYDDGDSYVRMPKGPAEKKPGPRKKTIRTKQVKPTKREQRGLAR